ncbi:MAG: leucine-rich repeat domain-containing protein [Candidatus Bathyarchaeota archaeon]|uniref:leucine-rich repeat domain-containing protein n=1 Tax=Candidatus Bathycorpusculum sp. TaxID=2994959 RepID=UPI00281E7246|nr:leucine-rich repeat domain-containing protein [Candidatus Termiticorpusculum sp.]
MNTANIKETDIVKEELTAIGREALAGCEKLTAITVPNSIVFIDENVFTDCENLVAINVAEDNKHYCSIDGVLFNKDRTTLIRYPSGKRNESYTVPDNIEIIGERAFRGCQNLTSINIGSRVKTVDERAFMVCDNLTAVNVAENNKHYSSIDGVLFNKNKTILIQYPCGKTDRSYIIPDSVKTIRNVFLYCDNLISITIGGGVTVIDGAIFGCENLVAINVAENNKHYSSIDGVLFNKDKTVLIQYPDGKTDRSYIVPNSVKTIHDTFQFCENLISITIPKDAIIDEVSLPKNCIIHRQ